MPELALQTVGSGTASAGSLVPAPAFRPTATSGTITGVDTGTDFGCMFLQNMVGSAITTASVTLIQGSTTNIINQLTTMGYHVTAANMTQTIHGQVEIDLQLIQTGMAGTTSMTNTIDLTTWAAWNRGLGSSVTTGIAISTTSSANVVTITNPWPAWVRLQNQTLPQIQRTLQQQEEYRAQQLAYEATRVQAEGEKAKARDRAAKLLQEQLTPEQRAELAAKGFFSLQVISATGKRHYRINRGRSRNVQEVDPNGKVLKTICAHPQIQCPDEDTMLTQKLMLEACEPEFLKVANIQTH